MFFISRNNKSHEENGERGAITVFLSINLLLIMTLTGMLVDGARLRTGETTMARVTANSLHSVLSHYDQTLKDDYGLFALAMPQEAIIDYLLNYMEKGIDPVDNFSDLYGFQIEEIKVNALYDLEKNIVIQQQILEYMKYYAPKIIVTDVLSIFNVVSDVGEVSSILEEKIKIEKELIELAYLEKELEENITIASTFSLYSFQNNNRIIQDKVQLVINNQAVKEQQDMVAYETLVQSLVVSLDQEINYQIMKLDELLLSNFKIVNLAEEIKEKNTAINKQLEELKEKTEGKEDKALTNKVINDVDNYLKATENHNTGNLIKISKENIKILNESKDQILKVESIFLKNLSSLDRLQKEIDVSIEEVENLMGTYNTNYIYSKWEMEVDDLGIPSREDRRSIASKEANDLIEGVLSPDKIIPASLQAVLPSSGNPQDYKAIHIDFNDNTTIYHNDAFSLIDKLTLNTSDMGVAFRDTLYIHEYIIGTFKSLISDHHDFQENFRGESKLNRTAFFDYEIEYILYGHPSQNQNLKAVKRDLLMFRFVVNLVYVMTNQQLIKDATIIATILAAPVGGAAMPFIKTMILSGWAIEYSVEEVKKLLEGESVAFYRNQDNLVLHYEDYLRILLFRPGLSNSIKLDRIKDLIQLNLQQNSIYGNDFYIAEAYTYVNVEIYYSMKVVFFKRHNNRSYYQLELWQGY